MIYSKFLQTWRGTRSENRFHRMAHGGLAVGVVLLGVRSFFAEPVVIIVPPTLNEKVEVTRNRASEGYQRAWALFYAELLGNVTPDTAGFVREALAPLLDPQIYGSAMEAMALQIEEIKRNRVTQRFEPRTILYEPSTDKVFVRGVAFTKGLVGEEARSDRTYEVRVSLRDWRPVFTHMATYSGEPKTSKELERQQHLEDRRRANKRRQEG
ncbi:TraE/TraK family type IV conjugative transfer system protein [Azospirillum sp. sgz302134]